MCAPPALVEQARAYWVLAWGFHFVSGWVGVIPIWCHTPFYI